MSSAIPAAWNVVDACVEAVTIVGPRNPAQFPVGTYENIDYPVTYRYVFQSYRREAYYDKDKDGNWTVPRIRHTGNEPTRKFYNASHGAIGGTPGFSGQHTNDGPYDYALDVKNSFNADRDVRDGMRARPGFEFLPEWYGFYPTDPEAQ
jgi:hypothetical protein